MKSFRITLTIWFQKEKFGQILQLFSESRKMKGNFLQTLLLLRTKLLVAGSPPLNWCMDRQLMKYCRSTRLPVWITGTLTVAVKRFLLIGLLTTHGLDLNYSKLLLSIIRTWNISKLIIPQFNPHAIGIGNFISCNLNYSNFHLPSSEFHWKT